MEMLQNADFWIGLMKIIWINIILSVICNINGFDILIAINFLCLYHNICHD